MHQLQPSMAVNPADLQYQEARGWRVEQEVAAPPGISNPACVWDFGGCAASGERPRELIGYVCWKLPSCQNQDTSRRR